MTEHVWYSAVDNRFYLVSKDLHQVAQYLRKVHGKNPATIYLGEL